MRRYASALPFVSNGLAKDSSERGEVTETVHILVPVAVIPYGSLNPTGSYAPWGRSPRTSVSLELSLVLRVRVTQSLGSLYSTSTGPAGRRTVSKNVASPVLLSFPPYLMVVGEPAESTYDTASLTVENILFEIPIIFVRFREIEYLRSYVAPGEEPVGIRQDEPPLAGVNGFGVVVEGEPHPDGHVAG